MSDTCKWIDSHDPDGWVNTQCGESWDTWQMKLNPDFKFCPYCGKPISIDASVATEGVEARFE